jgi:hypothetical protein
MHFDFREYRGLHTGSFAKKFAFPERNLFEALAVDPDPFVGASLFANEYFEVDWEQRFAGASHLERLALMRRADLRASLIKKIFDPTAIELDIGIAERKELAIAFLRER